jgi:ADP-L-glycero-D-manno-heptose 6-epimerase
MKYVITGAAGFIGSNLIKYFNELGIFNIVAIDTIDAWPRILDLNYDCFLSPDRFLISEGDVLIHLGACTDTQETNVEYIMNNNFTYSTNIIEQALAKNCRVIYASSAGVYGNGSNFADSEYFDDVAWLSPTTPYARSKQHLDLWNIATGIVAGGMKCTGLRFFNVWGDREQHKGRMESLVSSKYNEIIEGKPQRLFSHPTKKLSRDFIYVKDVVKIIHRFASSQKTGIFNVGTGISTTWHELVNNYFDAVGKSAIIEEVEFPKEREDNYQFFTQSDNTKLLGLEFMKNYRFYSLPEAFKDFIHERARIIK